MNTIKSKQRVADHGEVFTTAWLVEAMVDLVNDFHLLVRLKLFKTRRLHTARLLESCRGRVPGGDS